MDDFLIIGGGVAGLSAGAALSELGTVRVLEAEDQIGYHASGRSAALYEQSYGKPSTVALNIASLPHHEAAGVLSPRGLLLVSKPEEVETFEADIAGMGLTEISMDAARAKMPILSDGVTRAAYDGAAQDIDTDRLLQGYAKAIRDGGGTVVTKARVTAISGRGPWTVQAGADYSGRFLINAAGPWADQVAALAGVTPLGLQPFRRSMARLAAPGGRDLRHWPMTFGPGEGWYCKPDAGALLVSPAEEDPLEPQDAWPEDLVLAEGLARYEAHVTEAVTRPIATWAGLRTFAPDRNLVLGREPEQPDFIWAAGQGGYGMQSSPAAGRLVADLVANRAPEVGAEVVAQVSPSRFR